jgi:DNA polymerase I-like protein with 3'-5' exonuclease and polymerase domains
MLIWAHENSIDYLVGWNVVFDIAWLYAYAEGDDELIKLLDRTRFMDAMLLWRHWDIEPEYEYKQTRSYSLKAAVPLFFPEHAGYEADIEFAADAATDPAQLARLHEYNIKDCVFTLRLAHLFWGELSHAQQTVAITEAASFKMVARANLHGLIVDTLEAGSLSACLKQTAAARLTSLAPYGITEKVVRSPKQLGVILYDKWRLPVLAVTASGNRSTDKVVLHRLALKDKRVKEIKEYREALNNDTKFATAPLASVAYNQDGRSHPQARVFGTYTGRLTFSSKQGKGKGERQIGFALHQMKRDPTFRRIIVPPKGYTLMEFDAAGQEYRWMAIASSDSTMLKLCQPGQDPHAYMGARIIGGSYTQILKYAKVSGTPEANARQCGKVVNLCVARGVSVLTNRGYIAIQDIQRTDLVWDGLEFVSHDGVMCSGFRRVITYDGVTATPEHRVLVDGSWVTIKEAAAHGWKITSELGAGWKSVCRSAFRIMDGIVRRAIRKKRRALRVGTVRLWNKARSQLAIYGSGTLGTMQRLCVTTDEHATRPVYLPQSSRSTLTETGQRLVSTVQQPEVSIIPQLRRTWDRVSVCFGTQSHRVDQKELATSDVSPTRYRPDRQRWALRAWQFALGYAQPEPQEQTKETWVYDIVNCGPRRCFAANGRIVHNSSQYRVGFKKLQQIAEIDYGIAMSIDEAQRIQRIYLNTYPGIPRYWQEQISKAQNNGYVETIAGRRVRIIGQWGGDKSWQMEGTAINYRIQGTGADQKYLALRCVRHYLMTIGARFAWDLHDGLYFYVPHARVEDAAYEIKDTLDNLPYESVWGFTPPIPMPWDCKVGPSWGDLKPFEFK